MFNCFQSVEIKKKAGAALVITITSVNIFSEDYKKNNCLLIPSSFN